MDDCLIEFGFESYLQIDVERETGDRDVGVEASLIRAHEKRVRNLLEENSSASTCLEAVKDVHSLVTDSNRTASDDQYATVVADLESAKKLLQSRIDKGDDDTLSDVARNETRDAVRAAANLYLRP
jgi:hypothetical protein